MSGAYIRAGEDRERERERGQRWERWDCLGPPAARGQEAFSPRAFRGKVAQLIV